MLFAFLGQLSVSYFSFLAYPYQNVGGYIKKKVRKAKVPSKTIKGPTPPGSLYCKSLASFPKLACVAAWTRKRIGRQVKRRVGVGEEEEDREERKKQNDLRNGEKKQKTKTKNHVFLFGGSFPCSLAAWEPAGLRERNTPTGSCRPGGSDE